MLSSLWAFFNPSILHFSQNSSFHRDFAAQQNKRTLFIQVGSLFFLFGCVLLSEDAPSITQKLNLLIMSILLLIFSIFCRSFPGIFKIFYILAITVFGPLFHLYSQNSVFFNFISISVFPIWTLCCTGSKFMFVFQFIVQKIWLSLFYEPRLVMVLDQFSTVPYVQRIGNAMTASMVVTCVFLFTIDSALKNAKKQAKINHAKVNELEKQKVSLLTFSHELRNLVNSITGTVKLCLLGDISSKVRELLSSSEVCCELLIHLVNNILDTGKAENAELEVVPKPSAIYDLLEKVWGVCSQLISSKSLAGQIRVNKRVPKILKIDNHRMTQIFLNLVGNAIKFTEKGSISITVDWLEGKEEITQDCFEPAPFNDDDDGIFEKNESLSILRQEVLMMNSHQFRLKRGSTPVRDQGPTKGILKISVIDTGCGIASDKIPKLFNKFTQVSDDQSKTTQGTGLGLFITKQLIDNMDGTIKVFSKVGKGSAFVTCIPAEALPEIAGDMKNFKS